MERKLKSEGKPETGGQETGEHNEVKGSLLLPEATVPLK